MLLANGSTPRAERILRVIPAYSVITHQRRFNRDHLDNDLYPKQDRRGTTNNNDCSANRTESIPTLTLTLNPNPKPDINGE